MQRNKNWASEGDNVKEFEEKFAKKFGYLLRLDLIKDIKVRYDR